MNHPNHASIPCLNTNNSTKTLQKDAPRLPSSHAKTAFAIRLNIMTAIERYGLECAGFLTLTFRKPVTSIKTAQRRFNSLATHVLKKRYRGWIAVVERDSRGRIHFHLLVICNHDIRSGTPFEAIEKRDYARANRALREEWAFWRRMSKKYGFGRCELLPIKTNAQAVGSYMTKYIGSTIASRSRADKGARLVRYSRGMVSCSTRFSWNTTGARAWRAKLKSFVEGFGLTAENYRVILRQRFGRNWFQAVLPIIDTGFVSANSGCGMTGRIVYRMDARATATLPHVSVI